MSSVIGIRWTTEALSRYGLINSVVCMRPFRAESLAKASDRAQTGNSPDNCHGPAPDVRQTVRLSNKRGYGCVDRVAGGTLRLTAIAQRYDIARRIKPRHK